MRTRHFYTVYTTWWLAWTAVHLYILLGFNISFYVALADSVATNVTLALFGLSVYNLLRYYQPKPENYFYLRIWVLLLTIVVSVGHNWLFKFLFSDDFIYMNILENSFAIRFCYHLLMLSFVSLLTALFYHFQEMHEDEGRKTQTEQLAREAELSKLRQQLQPHFLFNSLNSIGSLAGSNPEEARKMIHQLSEFLRGTLKKDEQQMIPLKDELHHLGLYLEIEKVRFGHRLKTELTIEDPCKEMLLPPLLLQPVVENAIKFGLYDTMGQVTVRIQAKTDGNTLRISVENPFDPDTSSSKKGAGFGLSSVRRRLDLLFARPDLLQTERIENIFITHIHIPQHS